MSGFQDYLTTNAAGSFSTQSDGFVQGMAMDDPSVRYYLSGGVLAATETLPMWGGVPIIESIPLTGNGSTGGVITSATTVANMTGFTVFNQATNWITTPQSECPSAGPGMMIPLYRFNSGARIPVKCDPGLAAAILGGSVIQQVSWDFNNRCLQAYDASTGTVSVTSITSSYSSTTGLYTFVVVCAAASLVAAVGDFINVSGVTGTGASLVNGDQIVTAFTDNEHFSFQIAAASGAIATGALSGTIVLNEGVGAINVKILGVNQGNSMTVAYDGTNVHWVQGGTTALILI
jgi:hypothetical protein